MKNTIQIGILIAALVTAGCGAVASDTQRRSINPKGVMDSRAFGYSQAVTVNPGARLVYVSGQVGLSEAGDNGFEAQVDRAFENLETVLRAANSTVDDVVRITLLVKEHDAAKMQYLIEKRRALFTANPPASTLIPVPMLALEELEFEVDAIAMVPDDRYRVIE